MTPRREIVWTEDAKAEFLAGIEKAREATEHLIVYREPDLAGFRRHMEGFLQLGAELAKARQDAKERLDKEVHLDNADRKTDRRRHRGLR